MRQVKVQTHIIHSMFGVLDDVVDAFLSAVLWIGRSIVIHGKRPADGSANQKGDSGIVLMLVK